MTTRAFLLLGGAWSLLALATLILVVRSGDALAAGIIAWVGGVLTYPLVIETVRRGRIAS